jgi:hypothetical protein
MQVRIFAGGLLALVVVVLGLAQSKTWAAEDEDLQADLRQLQGKWEYTFKDNQGNVIVRKVKEIKDETETVTWHLPSGKVYQVNWVDFKLERKGKDRILTYSNWKYLEGPDKGKEVPGKIGSFAYRIEGDTWMTLETGIGEIPWQRVKEGK